MKKVWLKILAKAGITIDGTDLPFETEVKVDEETAKDLIEKGLAEDIGPAKAKAALDAEIQKGIADGITS